MPASPPTLTRPKNILSRITRLTSLKELVEGADGKTIDHAIGNPLLRAAILKVLERMLARYVRKDETIPVAVRERKIAIGKALLTSAGRFLRQAQGKPLMREALCHRVIPALMTSCGRQAGVQEAFRVRFGRHPPAFLTISPTRCCNLNCAGCYANANATNRETLEYAIVDRIVQEKKELWGSWFTVISGGEPFMYRSSGKTILDLFEAHPDVFFLAYTNGTLLSEEVAQRLARLGNVTLGLSVEGYEEETDRRRGKGVYRKVLQGMDNLRRYGVPYGVSMTVFRENADLLNEQFFHHYVDELGALYIWIFQYMPIGRHQTLERVVTPEQRLRMYRASWEAVNRGVFLADFWNSGESASGCISAGRPGGYLYIDWNGNITPCVFNPYSPLNVHDLYASGKTLNDALQDPFFAAIRRWQGDYALDKPATETGNLMLCCPIRDHYSSMLPLLRQYKPRAIDPSGDEALKDTAYQEGMVRYGEQLAAVLDPIWQQEVLGAAQTTRGA